MNDALDQFRRAIEAAGLTPPDTIHGDGLIHRFSTNGKGNDDSGWYCLHLDGLPAGAFGCWRSGLNVTWCYQSNDTLTPEQKAEYRQRMEAIQRQREADRKAMHTAAAATAAQQWSNAMPCTTHPYLTIKGVKPHGVRVNDAGVVLVPMRLGGELVSLQRIAGDGEKRFLQGGQVKGAYHAIGKPAGTLVVCEGYATGASVHEATGHAVAIAFNAGNLMDVVKSLKVKFPDCKIIVAGDDDYQTEGNPGMIKATEAANAINGYLAVPDFGEDRPDKATDFNDLHQISGAEMVKACIDAATKVEGQQAQAMAGKWPMPQVIEAQLPPAPAFDAEILLPKQLAEFVLDEADRMPSAPDFVAAALIVAMGAVIGARCAIKPKQRDDWIVTPNLYGGIVGDPSAKKTPSLSPVMRMLDRLEAKEAEKLEESLKVYEAETAAFEARQAAVKTTMKKAAAGKGTDTALLDRAVQDLAELEPPEKPIQRRFKSNDATVEKLADILSDNPAGLLVFRDELVGLLASWEQEGRERDKAFYLEGWNGTGSFAIDRISRGSQLVKNLCLSVFGGIQPEMLEGYLSHVMGSMSNDGGFQRFQVLVYPEPVQWEWRDRYPVQGAREYVRDLFDRLAGFDPLQDGASPSTDFVKLPYFGFTEEAQAVFIEWTTELNTQTLGSETNSMLRQHWGKYDKLFCALALILHLAEGNIGPVGKESAYRAAAWCEYLQGHARRIYAMVEASKVTAAKAVAQRLKERKLQDGFTARDLGRKQWAGVTTSTKAEYVLSVLEDFGWIGAYEDGEGTGRPTTRYKINPRIWEGEQ